MTSRRSTTRSATRPERAADRDRRRAGSERPAGGHRRPPRRGRVRNPGRARRQRGNRANARGPPAYGAPLAGSSRGPRPRDRSEHRDQPGRERRGDRRHVDARSRHRDVRGQGRRGREARRSSIRGHTRRWFAISGCARTSRGRSGIGSSSSTINRSSTSRTGDLAGLEALVRGATRSAAFSPRPTSSPWRSPPARSSHSAAGSSRRRVARRSPGRIRGRRSPMGAT